MSAVLQNTEWMELGACREAGVDFYSGIPHVVEQAKAICRTCPVIFKCRDYARRNGEEFGVWGGEERGKPVAVKVECPCCHVPMIRISDSQEQCLRCKQVFFG